MAAVVCEGIMVQRPLEPTLSALQMPREARSSPAGPITNACGVRRREDAGRRAPTMGEVSSRIAQHDFAERFERGKLTFTGDVLQVISVVGRQQKFAKLLKRLNVGA